MGDLQEEVLFMTLREDKNNCVYKKSMSCLGISIWFSPAIESQIEDTRRQEQEQDHQH